MDPLNVPENYTQLPM